MVAALFAVASESITTDGAPVAESRDAGDIGPGLTANALSPAAAFSGVVLVLTAIDIGLVGLARPRRGG